MTLPPADEELALLEHDLPILQARAEQAHQQWTAADAILTSARKRRDFLLWQRVQVPVQVPATQAPLSTPTQGAVEPLGANNFSHTG